MVLRPRLGGKAMKRDLSLCLDCSKKLKNANWSPSMQKRRRFICRFCWTARQTGYNHNDPNFREKQNRRRARLIASWSPERREIERQRQYNSWLTRKYGISLEDYNQLLKTQKFACAICRKSDPKGRGVFHVDHCHKTNRKRGLLCSNCNFMLGLSNDSDKTLINAARYLIKFRRQGIGK